MRFGRTIGLVLALLLVTPSSPFATRRKRGAYRGRLEVIHLILKAVAKEKRGRNQSAISKDAEVTLTSLRGYLVDLQLAKVVSIDSSGSGKGRYLITDKGRKVIDMLERFEGIIPPEELNRVGGKQGKKGSGMGTDTKAAPGRQTRD